MDSEEILLLVGVAAASTGMLVFLAWSIYAHFLIVVPPNRALVVFGRTSPKRRESDPTGTSARFGSARYVVGGAAFVFPWTHSYASLPLSTLDLDVPVRGARCAGGPEAPRYDLRVGVQAKISSDPEGLRAAAENLLGRSETEVRSLVRSVIEGHVPSVLARVSSDQLESDRERIAAEVQVLAATDLVTVGMVLPSLSVKEVLPAALPSEVGAAAAPTKEFERSLWDLVSRLRRVEGKLEELERRSRTPEILPLGQDLDLPSPRIAMMRGAP